MNLFELTGTESNPIYQELEISNVNRQYDFLHSIVSASLQIRRPFLSTTVLKALNFHAITCLHSHAGEFRPCPVEVGDYKPPDHYRVQSLMDDFINDVNRSWDSLDAVQLASFVLWKLNVIHPFINGNGRTARAACYFVLCIKSKSWLPGTTILPELIRQSRDDYIKALKAGDASVNVGALDLSELHALLVKLLRRQFGLPEPKEDNQSPN